MDEEKKELLEIYKIHVEMADRVSQRRVLTNNFYISLLSIFFAIISYYVNSTTFSDNKNFIVIILCLIGVLLCIVWAVNINSYKQLNTAKFSILFELEDKLAFPFYKKEWHMAGEGKERKKYYQLTKIEKYAPLLLSLPYILLIVYIFIKW